MLGKGAIGQMAGSVGGTLMGGVLGAALFNPAGMAAMFSNPVGWVIGGGLLAGALISRLLANRTEKALRKTIQSEYGIAVKDMKLLTEIKQQGEGVFGKGQVSKHLVETVRLEPVKERLSTYAEATGQKSQLSTNRELQDASSAENRFIRRITGGIIPGMTRGYDHIPLLADGGEYVLNAQATANADRASLDALNAGRASIVTNQSSQSSNAPTGGGSDSKDNRQGGSVPASLMAAMVGVMSQVAETTALLQAKLKAMSAGDVLTAGAAQNPHAITDGLIDSFDGDAGRIDTVSKRMRLG